ncbi:MAG TPA: T9SS type A sorting domain-containing protein [Ignavibacteria bacterium]|nr:T9SS type A sorting domain-containing protein [Ignavibacteria bacterium]HMR40627.1 T9SS type A sorting domain-containing protein [Ignavibacteria bacterium]
MKFKKLILTLLVFFVSADLYSQSGKFFIHQTNDGTVIDISLYVKRNTGPEWSLGFASLVFFYNNEAMENPREITEGEWDDSLNADYGDQFFVFYGDGNSVSLEIGLDSLPSDGTIVSTDSMLVGTVRFDILDSLQKNELSWDLEHCAVLDNAGADITSNMIFSDPENVLLPVELSSFYFTVQRNEVGLHWITVSEKNNAGFKIERRIYGSESWTETGSVNGKGNTNEISEYTFKDKDLQPGVYNFRLKQTDFNGNYEYFELSENVNIEIPVSNVLSQNYPNPFNPNSQISYEVGSGNGNKVSVRLSVYNSLGKEVATLFKGEQDPGYYKVNFNGQAYPSGIYIYVLEADGTVAGSKRMILIK